MNVFGDRMVQVRSHWRRPPYSYGFGPKTVFVCSHLRRYRQQYFW